MATAERRPSISSSDTAAELLFDENEKNHKTSSEGSYANMKTPEEMEIGDDEERGELLPQPSLEKPEPAPESSMKVAAAWMVVNTLATIGIVCSPFPCIIGIVQTDIRNRSSRTKPFSRIQHSSLRSLPLRPSISS